MVRSCGQVPLVVPRGTTDDAGCRGGEARVSAGGGSVMSFLELMEYLNIPQVFLRNEECAFGGFVSTYVLLSPMIPKAGAVTYCTSESYYLSIDCHILGILCTT